MDFENQNQNRDFDFKIVILILKIKIVPISDYIELWAFEVFDFI